MHHTTHTSTDGTRVFTYRGTLPLPLGLLLLAPLALLFLSVAAMLLAGGTVLALFLPLFWRRRLRGHREEDCITLQPDQYTRIERR